MPSGARAMLSIYRPAIRQGPMAGSVLSSYQQVRGAGNDMAAQRRKREKAALKKSKKAPREFQQKNLKDVKQFALCDAMR